VVQQGTTAYLRGLKLLILLAELGGVQMEAQLCERDVGLNLH